MAKLKNTPASVGAGTKAGKIFAGAKVKDAGDRLSEKKYAIKGRDGNPLRWGSKNVETASEKDHAIVGVWFKRTMQKAGVPGITLTDWEKSLLADHVEKGRWVGDVAGAYYGGGADPSDYVPNTHVKALMDDTVSGGLFLTPYEFDSNIVTLPLLHSEVFSLCDVVPVSARRIDTARLNNLSLTWGQNPGTALTPFNTASLVSEIPTPTYPVAGAIELDNNMLVDSPVNIGAKVTELYSERLKAELDRVIVNGNGYNEPLGVTNTSGLVTVNADNGTGGPPTVSDYESLIFSVQKQYRQKDWNPAFVANDTSYRRARAIPVGPGDERRVMGMDNQSYTLLDYQYKVQNDIPNTRILFGCWKRYRAYQRLGSEVVVTREGRQLTLTNTTLVVIRARFGGQPIDPNAFALMTDAQS
ncbi:phage major capsid protein [Gemmata sp. G18]|uniref:Phage major capsid protein n=1 Tax=Gemmata palustris TaxID=2822762 RepID=A0ABS5BVI0_9BACT|nr:phage major capsid protein [Gemmata palustris]MBP3957734.1 phage major capsid protein [Gemmata palustris]